MRLIRFADLTVQPWKNGGGATREVAAAKDTDQAPGFAWRLSIATVDRDGPFSFFPGVDRTLVLLEGGGLSLHIEGRADPIALLPGDQWSFPGETRVDGRVTAGATLDFNVMTARGVAAHTVRRLGAGRHELAVAPGMTLALLSLGAGVVEVRGERPALGRYDCLIIGPGTLAVEGAMLVVEIGPSQSLLTRL
ncbi:MULTISPECIES: HutD family protein [unclassified Devosia]|uniref:HutD/Ves family protein n=1 Tax=unclassified Devosia TaxID=196773 RepID=UPI0008688D64|nr:MULTISPECIES: HutD family protein [unclassified Devosia]MBN9359910.1 HutD family protein [Devosia sp.]ODS85053.1 MAG: hypothetical protein ABS47_17850 [Devosia sp. SCN 66-27]OJX21987.1 MAG: hypothetical protein BGO83_13970 [Devosia sp. 66-14]